MSSSVSQQSSPYRRKDRVTMSLGASTTNNPIKQELRRPPFSPRTSHSRLQEIDSQRMFVYDHTKAEVEILDTVEDDILAASIYGSNTTKRSKAKKRHQRQKKKGTTNGYNFGVSGYDFDSLLADESSHSTNTDFQESSSSTWHEYR